MDHTREGPVDCIACPWLIARFVDKEPTFPTLYAFLPDTHRALIGCQSAAALRKAGFDARYMAGGHYAWKAIKGPVKLFQ